jgi:hypothetical protein
MTGLALCLGLGWGEMLVTGSLQELFKYSDEDIGTGTGTGTGVVTKAEHCANVGALGAS